MTMHVRGCSECHTYYTWENMMRADGSTHALVPSKMSSEYTGGLSTLKMDLPVLMEKSYLMSPGTTLSNSNL